ncbi:MULTISPECIES: AAA family ATPase [unclassified Variovorax]|nr:MULTISPECIES: AAA family ATPase [unclassified Variovorax]
MTLLERDGLLAQLNARWSQAREGPGQLVFVEGEAGIGKTSVLRAFAASVRTASPLYWGSCEAMATPRPLGALDDIAMDSGGKLAIPSHGGSGERHRLFVAFMDLLAVQPALAVLEDLHWADEATLDLLRYAGRRIARTRSLLIASFRNDELVPSHPLRAVLGDLATAGAPHLAPQPLSLAAVRSLSAGTAIDAAALHEQTAGNPFFVTEVIAASAKAARGVPATVQDAVLARAGRLSPSARAVLDAAAVAGPRAEPWLLYELTAAESGSIDECLATGVLRADGVSFAFRHELARQSVLQAIPPTRAIGLHRLVLQALLANDAAKFAARLVLHAEAAGDLAALRHWAPVAARQAASRGAHRQAAEHWARALAHCDPGAERAALLDASAEDVHMSIGLDESIAVRSEAARLWCEHGRPDNAAVSLARQSLIFLYAARNPDAAAALRAARSLVADQPGSRAARVVQSCAASLCQYERESEEAIALASAVLDQAEREDDKAEMAMCLKTIGRSQIDLARVDEGLATLERALALAQGANENRLASQIFASLGAGCVDAFRLAEAETWLRKGIDFCTERDLDATRLWQTAWLAHALLEQSRWDEAASAAHAVTAAPKATVIARIKALVVLGLLRARRGDPGVWSALDEARDLATGTGPDRFHVARVEATWLEGRDSDAACEAAAHLSLATAARRIDLAAQLALWCRLGGDEATPIPDFCAKHSFALEAAGPWQDAAEAWRALGCPFETARALAQGDEAAQRQALAMLEVLGAWPLVERVRQRLRAAGVRGLPRGMRRSTRQHPASLTDTELAVLELLAAGLRNKEIAVRLHRSARTVEHHLAAIFIKLHVATRAEAVSAAYRLGIVSGKPASA